ncbi:hypothetical protein ACS0TY_022826 [Phlomoides rotata]
MDGIASNSFQMKMDRGNHHRVAQVEESDVMKTMMMTLMEKFDALSGSIPRETLPPLVQEQQGVQEVNYMGRPNFQGGNYHQGKQNFQSQPQGQFPQNTQGRYNTSNFQGGSFSYNPNFKNHENFSYANQRAAVQFPPGFDPGAKLLTHEGKATNEDALAMILKKMEGMEAHVTQMGQQFTQMNQQQKTMEFQMGQLATTVGNIGTKYQRPSLPSEENIEEKATEIEQEAEDDKVSEKEEEEEIAPLSEDEEEKSKMKSDKEELKKKLKKDESAQKVPKWRLARDLKEKMSYEIECDAWGIPKNSSTKEDCHSIQVLNHCEEGVKMMKQESSPKMSLKYPGDRKEEKGRKKGRNITRLKEKKNITLSQEYVRMKANDPLHIDTFGRNDPNDFAFDCQYSYDPNEPIDLKENSHPTEFHKDALVFANKRKELVENSDQGGDGERGCRGDSSTSNKKQRLNWTPELHTSFLSAVNQIGLDKAILLNSIKMLWFLQIRERN